MGIRTRNKVSTNFSMSSMTDLVFLLLIFFILLSTLVSQNALNLHLPQSTKTKHQKSNVVVSVNENIEYFVNQQKVAFDEIESRVIALLQNKDKKAFLLEMDKTVPVDEMVKIMTIAKKHDIKVALATEAR